MHTSRNLINNTPLKHVHILLLRLTSSFDTSFHSTIIVTRLQKRLISLAGYEHVLLTLFDDGVVNPMDLEIRKTCTERGMRTLLRKPRLKLEEISFKSEKSTQVGRL